MEIFIPITLFISVAAVLILRPMTSRIGALFEAMAQERTPARAPEGDPRVVALLEHVSRRLDLIEERVDFAERLMSRRTSDDPMRHLGNRTHAQTAEY